MKNYIGRKVNTAIFISGTGSNMKNLIKFSKTNKSPIKVKLVKTSLNKAFSLIDKAVKKNVLHKNNGANKKSRINNFVKTTLTTK